MVQRTRTRNQLRSSGSLWRRGNPPLTYGPWTYQSRYEKCVDHYGKKKREDGTTPPTGLYLFKETCAPLLVDYKASSLVDSIVYDIGSALPCTAVGVGENWVNAGQWASIEPTQNAITATIVSRSNPFRYKVSVPVMVSELIEASTLLKIGVNNLFQAIGSQHLNYTFGWEAMRRDIRDLTQITREIESRVREFNSLVDKGGLRRRVKIGRYKGNWPTSGSYQTSVWSTHGLSFAAYVETVYTSEIWGTVRWKPQRDKKIDVQALAAFNEAAKIVLDIDGIPGPSSIWEMIPFTWLLDYFVNVGETLQAIENSDLVIPYDICIMRHRRVYTVNKLVNKTNDSYPWRRTYQSSGGKIYQEFKLRDIAFADGVGDLLSFGFMSKSQATNLIALILSMTRFRLQGQV